MRFESFKLGAKCWLQSLNQCLSPHPWPACWSMTLQNPDTTGHTYIQETTYQIRRDSPLCAKSECPRLPVWSMLLKKKKSIPWNSCARILPSFFPGCAVLIRFPRGAGGSVQAVGKCALLPGCRIVSGSSQSPWRAGAPERFCASKLFKLLLVPHILPFFRLAAIIFFFCKIFCKQPQKKQQKAIIKKGKERWHYDQETIAISHPSRHLATCCWHEVGANDLFVQRYIFYEEFVKLLNML